MQLTQTTPSNPGLQPTFSQRLRTSKALLPSLAVMGVTVAALAAALVVTTSGAAPTGPMTVLHAAEPITLQAAAVPVRAEPVVLAQASTQGSKAAVCATCGKVESVTPVQRQGQVNGVAVGGATVGLGTVAGGVVGGLLGNQVGGGNGKTAMTVLGVAGGAMAGNAIEKNMKKVTVYQMRVRMQDGSVRTIEQAQSVPAGSQVVVEGKTLRLTGKASS
ncbi:MAG: glycine zipper 2TM domain-containing protein [Pseudomonadota bacterium]